MLLKRFILLTMLTILISGCTEPPKPFEIIFNNPIVKDYVIGINNLQIDGVNYNVQFKFGTFSNVFGESIHSAHSHKSLPFWGNQNQAMIATNKIVDALNTIDPESACVLNKFQPYCVFFVPIAADKELTAIAWSGGREIKTNYSKHKLLALQGTSNTNRSYALIYENPN
jgi:hypothetical protein